MLSAVHERLKKIGLNVFKYFETMKENMKESETIKENEKWRRNIFVRFDLNFT